MIALFVVQLTAFALSLVLLSRWVNRILESRDWVSRRYLPWVSWGWCVYLVPYLVGRWAVAPVEGLRYLYVAIAFGVAVGGGAGWLVARARGEPRRWPPDPALGGPTVLVVLVFVAFMVGVGPYLEFPTDPLSYLYGIQAWEKARWLDYDFYYAARAAAFVDHWLLQPSGVEDGDRTGLTILSALMQGLLFWQVIRLGTLLTGEAMWGWLAGLLSLGYFGFGPISFYRYVVFSGPMAAYIAYLEGLVLLVAAFRSQEWRYLPLLFPILLFGLANHPQEALLLLNAVAGLTLLLVVFRLRTLRPRFRRLLLLGAAVSVVVVPALIFVATPVDPRDVVSPFYVSHLSPPWGGTLRYHPAQLLDQMVGVVGWSMMVLSAGVLLLNRPDWRLDIAAALTVWPLLVAWNPVAYEALGRLMSIESIHRILYGSPFWLFPVVLLKHVVERLGKGARASLGRWVALGVLALLLMASLIPTPPVNGKLLHLAYRPDRRLDGRNLRRVIEYLRANAEGACVDPITDPRLRPIRRYVVSDPYVNAYLQATGHFYTVTDRRENPGYEAPDLGLTTRLPEEMDLPQFLAALRKNSVCYVILYLQRDAPPSWLGAIIGHWATDAARTERYYSPRLIEWVTGDRDAFELVFERPPTRVYRVR
jgi:hypothetical protein